MKILDNSVVHQVDGYKDLSVPRVDLSPEDINKMGLKKIEAIDRQILLEHSEKFFSELDQCTAILTRYFSQLKDIFAVEESNLIGKADLRKYHNSQLPRAFITALAKGIKDEPNKLKKESTLSDDDKRLLVDVADQYLNCRSAISLLHCRLVYKALDEHLGHTQVSDFNRRDYINSGMLHLLKLIDSYDPNLGSFSGYVTESLLGYMLKVKGLQRMIHIPSNRVSETKKAYAAIEEQLKATGSENLKVVAEKLGISERELEKRLLQTLQPSLVTELSTNECAESEVVIFQNELFPDSTSSVLEDLIKTELNVTAETEVDILKRSLSNKYYRVLFDYYVLNKTYEEISKSDIFERNVSRQRVEQVLKKAVKNARELLAPARLFAIEILALIENENIEKAGNIISRGGDELRERLKKDTAFSDACIDILKKTISSEKYEKVYPMCNMISKVSACAADDFVIKASSIALRDAVSEFDFDKSDRILSFVGEKYPDYVERFICEVCEDLLTEKVKQIDFGDIPSFLSYFVGKGIINFESIFQGKKMSAARRDAVNLAYSSYGKKNNPEIKAIHDFMKRFKIVK